MEEQDKQADSKHTPGPWKVMPGNFIVTKKDEQIVAEVPCQGANENDLPLIAAAPKLLEACKLTLALQYPLDKSGKSELELGPLDTKLLGMLQAAIAEAEKGATK